eukprot:5430197-Alexandrium_andersonii.AAC.1
MVGGPSPFPRGIFGGRLVAQGRLVAVVEEQPVEVVLPFVRPVDGGARPLNPIAIGVDVVVQSIARRRGQGSA